MSRLRLKIEINKILNELNLEKNMNSKCCIFKVLKNRYPSLNNQELSYMIQRELQ
ncbi:MAG: hypothetical protein AB1389_08110 [Campylobacterota bacterium]